MVNETHIETSQSDDVRREISDLFAAKIIVCCGSGGVGKTTIAATLAVAGAQLGKRTCVVTIDPARRLANAMGLAALTNDPAQVHADWPGEVWALMLDVKATFDHVVRTYAHNEQQVEAILSNKMYASISETLSGTHEYLAMEKIYELVNDPRFDAIVVDTAPSRRALDFLDSSNRLTRFLENKLFRMIVFPTKSPLRLIGFGAQAFIRVVAKVVSAQVVSDAVEFFQVFAGMENGFRERSSATRKLLESNQAAFVVVANGEAAPLREAAFFIDKLQDKSIAPQALIFNRLEPDFNVTIGSRESIVSNETDALGALEINLHEVAARRNSQDLAIDDFLSEKVPFQVARQSAVLRVERIPSDIATLSSLEDLANHLLAVQPAN